jgi:drug/metabolite transporter (DMT)-like permease
MSELENQQRAGETSPPGDPSHAIWLMAMPALFVFLWSTGFIGAKLGLPYAEPFTYLAWRFAIVTVLMAGLSYLTRAPWPSDARTWGHIAVCGLLLHGTYLGGVFASINHGVPAGVSALIVGIQPLLTAIAAGPFLNERVTRLQWFGFLLGLLGVSMVVWTKLGLGAGTPWGMALSVIALLGMTAGTLYQKRFCPNLDLRTGSAIQFGAATVVVFTIAYASETMVVQWTGEFIFALAWMVAVMSLGAISLLFLLIRRGEATRVASLFYMVPPSTALLAYFLFDEKLGPVAIGGMAVAMFGVALVNARRP